MTFYSTDYINSSLDYQECYRYEIAPFNTKDYLRGFNIFAHKFPYSYEDSSNGPSITHAKYMLVGYIFVQSDGEAYDEMVPIALASELVELKVLADLNNIDPGVQLTNLETFDIISHANQPKRETS